MNLLLYHCLKTLQSFSFSLNGKFDNYLDVVSFIMNKTIYPTLLKHINYSIFKMDSITIDELQQQLHYFVTYPQIMFFINMPSEQSEYYQIVKSFVENCQRTNESNIFIFYPPVSFSSNTIIIYQNQLSQNNQLNQLTNNNVNKQKINMFGYQNQRKQVEELILSMNHPIPPLKPTGIFLFGPSGCGKTTLINEFCVLHPELNVKIIRAAEVLNKYVGESERKVRDLFNSNYDLIVFDDFDSLGHRRDGYKTDSVVNTLLTMLDGISIRKTAIVALSNRPDLVDPALLRSGRLGDWIYMTFPTKEEKMEVIQTLLEIDENEMNAFEEFDELTKRWTMADCVSFIKKIVSLRKENEIDDLMDFIRNEITQWKPSGILIDTKPIEKFISRKSEIGVEFDLL